MTHRHDSNHLELFGLPKSRLLPIAECVSGMSVHNFDITIDTIDAEPGTDEYGGCGEKCIVTFTCTGTDGSERRERVFAKLADHGHEESMHYEHLTRHNAPIPRTYGTLKHDDGRELMFTEYLEPILTWDDWNSPETHPEYLSAIAQINAITPSDEYQALLTNDFVRCELQYGLNAIEPAWECVRNGGCSKDATQWCAKHHSELPELPDFARFVIKQYESLPRGLCHRSAEGYHAGRRRSSGELLYFDLSTVGIGARFGDVASWCREPPIYLTRMEFAQQYVEQYARWGGPTVSVEQFLNETAISVRAGVIRWLWHMFSDWDETGDSSSGHWTHSALEQLVEFKHAGPGWQST